MKGLIVKNTTLDEANDITYAVMAARTLTDGELFRAIRGAILRSGRRPRRGETLVINLEDLSSTVQQVE
jgi:hypothetical protein